MNPWSWETSTNLGAETCGWKLIAIPMAFAARSLSAWRQIARIAAMSP
jgi:hypothetical protein